jgi:hypothetical protein
MNDLLVTLYLFECVVLIALPFHDIFTTYKQTIQNFDIERSNNQCIDHYSTSTTIYVS